MEEVSAKDRGIPAAGARLVFGGCVGSEDGLGWVGRGIRRGVRDRQIDFGKRNGGIVGKGCRGFAVAKCP
jgi:hypothetical protein